MRYLTLSLAALALSGVAQAQTADTPTIQVRSHYMGEPVSRFLKLEIDAREEVAVCEDHPDRLDCIHLLNAAHGSGRAEVSTLVPADLFHLTDSDTRDSIDFIIDSGKLVKLTMTVSDMGALQKMLGHPSNEADIPSQNAAGAKWTNHQSIWDLPSVYVTIFQDNNPSLVDHRPVLGMESGEEHAREAADSTKVTAAEPK